MNIVINILNVIWIASLSASAFLIALDILTFGDDFRDHDKSRSRMKIAAYTIVCGIMAKMIKFAA